MIEEGLLRLKTIEVERLFKLYDHRIALNLGERVTLLHGPNGVGKTVVLRIVDSMLNGRFSRLRNIPFRSVRLEFEDGTQLALVESQDGDPAGDRNVRLELVAEVGGSQSATLHWPRGRIEDLLVDHSYIEPHPEQDALWIDMRDGEVLSEDEILARFGRPPRSRMPQAGRRSRKEKTPDWFPEPDWFPQLRDKVSTHLVEAQRLLRVDWGAARKYPYYSPRARPPTVSTVVEYAQDFQRRIGETMARYGRTSQTLDQTFPERLIGATDSLAESDLRERMTALDKKRAELKTMGILDETPAHPFDVSALRDLDPTQSRVMTLYVHDTAEKLKTLEDLANRTRLLLESVNRKFQHKHIRMDREKGFVAENDIGEELRLVSLSSGEQHELVLLYDVLFRVRPNTVVLIDEPELSLHVAWQKRFLPELLEIVGTANFDALIATHSPFIIGDRTDLMVGLGGSEE
ncbi:MAG: AAA family ATPase [Gammaproteobacteria bacterium]|nr:AAA family ATPase [Gammaproteobacteria bacterium]